MGARKFQQIVIVLSLILAGCRGAEAGSTLYATPAATPATNSATTGSTPAAIVATGAAAATAALTPPGVTATPVAQATGSATASSTARPAATPTTPVAHLDLGACQLSGPSGGASLLAQCGTLLVYENRAAQAGKQIGLHVAVLRATGRQPAADPLFFIAGGPGDAATQTFVPMQAAFAAINATRDIVLVDQRGTGQSNPLNCPGLVEPLANSTPDQLTAAATACLAQLPGDSRMYTTSIAVDDLNEVRAALGYARINLYGLSYGTRVALSYLRRYPDRVRALVLDGVVPPDETLGLRAAGNAQHALNLILKHCADDRVCHLYFRDPQGDFNKVTHRLQDLGPVPLSLGLGGETTQVNFTYNMFANTVWLLSYSAQSAALLPLLIHTARYYGDYRPLALAGLQVGAQLARSTSTGMTAAVLCSEDAPHITPQNAAGANGSSYLGNSQTDWLQAVCANWPAGFVPRDARQGIESDVPTLLLSGEDDPATPPSNALRLARTFVASLDLTIPGQGHGVITVGCLPDVAARFIAAGTANGLDASCINQITAPKFVFTLPAP